MLRAGLRQSKAAVPGGAEPQVLVSAGAGGGGDLVVGGGLGGGAA